MLRDVLSILADTLFRYQRGLSAASSDQQLTRALDAVLEQRIRPVIARRLRPDDVEDVLSEIRIAFWRYRYSIRPDETGRFMHAVAHRKLADQLRQYYKRAELQVGETEGESGSLLDLLPAPGGDPALPEDQRVWELLAGAGLGDVDVLTAYLLYLGLPKGEIARALGISPNTVTNARKRCCEQLGRAGYVQAGGQP